MRQQRSAFCSLSHVSIYLSRQRFRTVSRPATGAGQPCSKKLEKKKKCRLPVCTDQCVMEDWSSWGPCTETCGAQGVQSRYRQVQYTAQRPAGPREYRVDIDRYNTLYRDLRGSGGTASIDRYSTLHRDLRGPGVQSRYRQVQYTVHNSAGPRGYRIDIDRYST